MSQQSEHFLAVFISTNSRLSLEYFGQINQPPPVPPKETNHVWISIGFLIIKVLRVGPLCVTFTIPVPGTRLSIC